MPTPNPAATAFLLARQSRPAKSLALPVPDREQITELLTAAARVPDHGKLEPWRFVVLERPALNRLADLAEAQARVRGGDDEMIAKGRGPYDGGLLAVAVIAAPKPHPKIPEIEQLMSAAAVCLGLVNAAEAAGWGACWLTGWPAHDPAFRAQAFGCAPHESVAGIVHIASETTPPAPRPRPDLAALTTWVAS